MKNEIYKAVLAEMNRLMPYEEVEYRNRCVARAMSLGHRDKLTEDWVRRTLLGDVEDEFITYGQAVKVQGDYYKAVEQIKAMF